MISVRHTIGIGADVTVKYGVLGFSYNNFENFPPLLNDFGYYTSNLGDSVQTVASRKALLQCGVAAQDILEIDRDTLREYSGPPAALLMNGVFSIQTLPTPSHVRPIFLGFTADVHTIAHHSDWLRQHAPIGCRDTHTAQHCRDFGIDAFVTGCVSITLPRREKAPVDGRLHVVLGADGMMPLGVLKHIPDELLQNAVFLHNRNVEKTFPLSREERAFNQLYVSDTLRKYREEASLVLTPLLHVSSPCVAMGVPTIICRHSPDPRFGFMHEITPVHTPETFKDIDWSPSAPDVENYAKGYFDRLQERL